MNNNYILISFVCAFLFTGCITPNIYNSPYSQIEQDCGYSDINGREFVIRSKYFAGYWTYRPIVTNGLTSRGRHPDGKQYVYMHGKLHANPIEINFINYYVATLENCEELYTDSEELEKLIGIFFIDTLNEAKSMIGKSIWINNNNVYMNQELSTDNQNTSYPLDHLEEVIVTGTETMFIWRIKGSGPFYLIAKKKSGETGYLSYNDRYFYRENPIPLDWQSDIVTLIRQRRFIMGMTQEQVMIAWGKPENINRSVGSWGVHEQWVYNGDRYLYFEKGKLTSWQD